MRLVVVSLTSTIGSIVRREQPPETIHGTDVMFYLGCAREHVFDPGLPMEATWPNKKYDKRHSNDGRPTINDVDPDKRELVTAVIDTIKAADADGRVVWRCGNYTGLIRTLHPDQNVYYCGTIQAASNWA